MIAHEENALFGGKVIGIMSEVVGAEVAAHKSFRLTVKVNRISLLILDPAQPNMRFGAMQL